MKKTNRSAKTKDIYRVKAKVDERVTFYISEVIKEYRTVLKNLAK
jgi:hypothetical protein